MDDKGRYPPWSRTQYLQEMSKEAGIDFDQLLADFKDDLTVKDMARRFNVSEDTISSLKDHFLHYGISSVIGGD